MKNSEKATLWRGFNQKGRNWVCGHCSAVVDDPALHTKFHRDLNECVQLATGV